MGDPAGHPDPSLRACPEPTARVAPAIDRLAHQLNTLSELVEAITFRLLELEEKVSVQQQRLEPLVEASDREDEHQDALRKLRFDQTEQRLSHLEQLLQLAHSPGPQASFPESAPPLMAIDGPFPEELEQPFMDDVPA